MPNTIAQPTRGPPVLARHLQGVLAVAEDDEVVPEQVVLLVEVPARAGLLQRLQLRLRRLAVVELEVAAPPVPLERGE